MARLHEYQGKAILAANGFRIPRGRVVSNPDDAVIAAKELGGEVVTKIQRGPLAANLHLHRCAFRSMNSSNVEESIKPK